jgi:hypothetical protein
VSGSVKAVPVLIEEKAVKTFPIGDVDHEYPGLGQKRMYSEKLVSGGVCVLKHVPIGDYIER